MNSKRLYYILLATVGLLALGLVGGAYGANALLRSQSEVLLDARSRSQSLETQSAQLVKAKNDIAKYRTLGDIAKSVVPQDKDQAQTVREIVKIAQTAGIRLGSINFPSSTLGSKAPAAAAAPTAPAAAPAPSPKSPLAISQLKPVPGISGVYELAITIQSDSSSPAPFSQFISFLAGLENNRRTALVSGINLTPDAKDPGSVSFTLNISEYIKP